MSQVKPTEIPPKPERQEKKRKGLRRASRKRAQQLAAYAILRPIYLRSHPYCEAFHECLYPAVHIHHKKGRAKEMLCDEEWFLPVCSEHHAFIHNFPNKARELGLLLF